MAPPTLKVYFDMVSPFAYISFHVITNTQVFEQCTVEWVPALLGGIMKATGNTAPLFIKNKDKYINDDRLRSAKLFNVPMRPDTPPGFPVQTVAMQRHMAVLHNIAPDQLVPAMAAVWQHFFVQHGGIKDPADFMPVLERAVGGELAARVHAAAATDGKTLLEANTTAALNDGAFGMPWYVCTTPAGATERFWGVDRLGQVVDALGLQRPATGWRSLL